MVLLLAAGCWLLGSAALGLSLFGQADLVRHLEMTMLLFDATNEACELLTMTTIHETANCPEPKFHFRHQTQLNVNRRLSNLHTWPSNGTTRSNSASLQSLLQDLHARPTARWFCHLYAETSTRIQASSAPRWKYPAPSSVTNQIQHPSRDILLSCTTACPLIPPWTSSVVPNDELLPTASISIQTGLHPTSLSISCINLSIEIQQLSFVDPQEAALACQFMACTPVQSCHQHGPCFLEISGKPPRVPAHELAGQAVRMELNAA
jgi:hypothetical protein